MYIPWNKSYIFILFFNESIKELYSVIQQFHLCYSYVKKSQRLDVLGTYARINFDYSKNFLWTKIFKLAVFSYRWNVYYSPCKIFFFLFFLLL